MEGGGDLLDGVLARVVHLLRLVELERGELGPAAADPAPGTGGSEPFQGAFDGGFPVELGQRGHDAEEPPTDRRARVDACSSTTKSTSCFSNQADRSSRC